MVSPARGSSTRGWCGLRGSGAAGAGGKRRAPSGSFGRMSRLPRRKLRAGAAAQPPSKMGDAARVASAGRVRAERETRRPSGAGLGTVFALDREFAPSRGFACPLAGEQRTRLRAAVGESRRYRFGCRHPAPRPRGALGRRQSPLCGPGSGATRKRRRAASKRSARKTFVIRCLSVASGAGLPPGDQAEAGQRSQHERQRRRHGNDPGIQIGVR